METIKTAAVVVLLLGVLYGVYVVLNKPELSPPPDVIVDGQELTTPDVQIDIGAPSTEFSADSPSQPGEMAASFPEIDSDDFGDSSTPVAGASLANTTSVEPLLPETSPAEIAEDPQPELRPNLVPPSELANSVYGAPNAAPVEPESPPAAPPATDSAPQPGDSPSIYTMPEIGGSSTALASDAAAGVEAGSESTVAPPEAGTVRAFDSAWSSAISLVEQQNWTEALLTLSLRYNDPELTAEERQRLVDLLDPLAGKVIYSREHTMIPAHVVKAGETLEQIASQYEIPMQLLQNINGISNPGNLAPGTRLKVVRGPFRAEVDLEAGQLVLFARKYYAGRFPISLGNEVSPQPGAYTVQGKQPGHEYVTTNGTRLAAGTPDNPYGRWWIDLGANISIHESPEELPPHGLGSISLKTADAADVYGILSVGSQVQIR